MKIFAICLFFFSTSFTLFAQSIEELERKLKTTEGADKVPVLKHLCELYNQAGNKLDEAYLLMELGSLQNKLGDIQTAITNFKKAEGNYVILKDAKGMVVSANHIGSAFSKYGDYEQATVYLSKALSIASKNNMGSEAAVITKNLEVVNKNKNNTQKTVTAFTQKKEKETINTISSLVNQNTKSLEEISKLSIEAQLQALTIKAQEDELLRKKVEAKTQKKINELLEKEKKLESAAAKEKTRKQNRIIATISGFTILLATLCLLIYRNFKQKKKANTELAIKNNAITNQKIEIEKKNGVIVDSIQYAKNIQNALLPSEEDLQDVLNEHFILNMPKDIVSGDFYWMNKIGNIILFAVADCTGHGVPGAFVSMMGHAYLNDIIFTTQVPCEILNNLNKKMLAELNKKAGESSAKYGMDITLIAIDKTTLQLQYASAHGSLLIIRNNDAIILKSDVRGVGAEREEIFKNHTVQLFKNDILYFNTDGFVDQRGGENNKKFLTKNFHKCLLQISNTNLKEQKSTLNNIMNEWKGANNQMDDMLVVGIKI